MAGELEAERLRSLYSYSVLDTLSDPAFDRLTRLAAELLDTPIALISLIDDERQWFKSRVGLDVESTPRQWAFCAHAIEQKPGAVFVVEDASHDPRFMNNPLVASDPHIRFYAGAVLTSSDGYNLGTLCVIDRQARPDLTPKERQRLLTLAQVVIDELELRKAKLEVTEKKAYLDLVEHMSGVGRWRVNVASGGVSWSDEVFRIHGLPVASGPPDLDSALAVYDQPDRDKLAGLIRRAIATGEGYHMNARIRRADGTERSICAKAECLFDDFGAVKALIGVVQDVTEHVQAAHVLRTVTDNVPGQISYWDKDLICRFANSACHEGFGRSRDDIVGMGAAAFLGDQLFRQSEPFIRAAFAGERQTFERTMTHADGGVRHWWVNYIPDFDDRGEVRGVFALSTDVTALKDSQLRLHEANALLAAALEKAEAATVVKSEFLANMSHEIRTPLTAIIGFTTLLKDRKDVGSGAHAQITQVAKAGATLLSIVNDILDFSKLEAGRIKIEPKPTAPTPLLQDTLAMFEPIAGAKGLTLEIIADRLPAAILIDPDKTRQILINLVANAIKFTDAGFVRVAAAYDGAAQRLQVRVQDTGPGLTTDQQGALFQRFSQVDGSASRRHRGSGLGLAICKGLAEAMGGSVGVQSVAGQGSTFHFDIAAPMAQAGPAATRVEAGATPLETLRILVVDDNSPNRELARILLEQLGAIVTEACDGFAAVETALTTPFDVILLDLHMPKLGGVDVLARIRTGDGPNRDAPILAFTADSAFERQDDCSQFSGLVSKPLAAPSLVKSVLDSIPSPNNAEAKRRRA